LKLRWRRRKRSPPVTISTAATEPIPMTVITIRPQNGVDAAHTVVLDTINDATGRFDCYLRGITFDLLRQAKQQIFAGDIGRVGFFEFNRFAKMEKRAAILGGDFVMQI